jgi:hypothetical protein
LQTSASKAAAWPFIAACCMHLERCKQLQG